MHLIKSFLLGLCLSFGLFHQLVTANNHFPLPKGLYALSSSEGQSRFLQSQHKASYWPLSAQLVTEAYGTYCGIASAVMVLNALKVPPPEDPAHPGFFEWTQRNIFTRSVRKHLPIKQINRVGMSLSQEAQLLAQFPLEAHFYYANSQKLITFRQQAIRAIDDPNSAIIAHYSRRILHQAGIGHFSPLAAYDQATDSFLIMDVARYKYPPTWVPCKQLFRAMRIHGRYRGYLIITRHIPNALASKS